MRMILLDRAKALLALLLEAVMTLGRSILGTFRSSTTADCKDKMDLVHGYWDPQNLCFIEESEGDLLELCSGGADEVRAARRRSLDDKSASIPETAGVSGKTKKC